MQRLTANLIKDDKQPYVVNLDPACLNVSYPCNIGLFFVLFFFLLDNLNQLMTHKLNDLNLNDFHFLLF